MNVCMYTFICSYFVSRLGIHTNKDTDMDIVIKYPRFEGSRRAAVCGRFSIAMQWIVIVGVKGIQQL